MKESLWEKIAIAKRKAVLEDTPFNISMFIGDKLIVLLHRHLVPSSVCIGTVGALCSNLLASIAGRLMGKQKIR